MGKIIVLEGLDFCGKTSVCSALENLIVDQLGVPVTVTRTPGGCSTGEKLRDFAFGTYDLEEVTETLLYSASFYENLHKTVMPALHRGDYVVCDRFLPSIFVYQPNTNGMVNAFLEEISRTSPEAYEAFSEMLTFIFDVDFEVAQRRGETRSTKNRRDIVDKKTYDVYRERYRNIKRSSLIFNAELIFNIDALGSVSEIAELVMQIIKENR